MDAQLNETLDYIGAVLIVGSKWSGLFILTGSNADDKKQITHSGTGRITKLQMYPMSLYESREFNGSISLYGLLENPDYDIDGKKAILRSKSWSLLLAAAVGLQA